MRDRPRPTLEGRVVDSRTVAKTDEIPARSRELLSKLARVLEDYGYQVSHGDKIMAVSTAETPPRMAEIWCQPKASDQTGPDGGPRLVFTWAGGGEICDATDVAAAHRAVNLSLRPRM